MDPVVSAQWLKDNLALPDLVVLNATLPKAASAESLAVDKAIPGARHFDFEHDFRDTDDPRPNSMPSPEKFTKESRKLGINHRSIIIVYDEHGIYSSPRAWWMFRSMGHKNVAVLDGGLPHWQELRFPVEPKSSYTGEPGNFFASYDKKYFATAQEILNSLKNDDKIVIDARSPGRFSGEEKEPREGMRSGHIPHSINLHYSSILNNNLLLDRNEISEIFKDKIVADKELICSCGSGITACIIALNAEIAGVKKVAVYDGSWGEWGMDASLPIEFESKG